MSCNFSIPTSCLKRGIYIYIPWQRVVFSIFSPFSEIKSFCSCRSFRHLLLIGKVKIIFVKSRNLRGVTFLSHSFSGQWSYFDPDGQKYVTLAQSKDLQRYVDHRKMLEAKLPLPPFFVDFDKKILFENYIVSRKLSSYNWSIQNACTNQISLMILKKSKITNEKISLNRELQDFCEHIIRLIYKMEFDEFLRSHSISQIGDSFWRMSISHCDLYNDNIVLGKESDLDPIVIDLEIDQIGFRPWWFDIISMVVIPYFWKTGDIGRRFLCGSIETGDFNCIGGSDFFKEARLSMSPDSFLFLCKIFLIVKFYYKIFLVSGDLKKLKLLVQELQDLPTLKRP